MKQLSSLFFVIAIVLLASCESSSMRGTWKQAPSDYTFTYTFTSSGYDKRVEFELLGKTYDDLTDNGSYLLKNGDITLYSGMGAGIITGTVSGKSLTIRGYTYTKQ